MSTPESTPDPTPLPDLLDELPRTDGTGGPASQADASRQTAQAALPSLPTPSTHGYEVPHSGTVDRTARLLAAFLARPLPVS